MPALVPQFIRQAAARATEGPGRIPSLDGLRALSIALVLFAHTSGTQYFPSFVFLRRNLGNFGVRVFFVISGFLITTLLIKELRTRGRISLGHFYIRRFFRIFPAAYAYIAVMAALTLAGLTPLGLGDFLHAVTYTVNYDRDRHWLLIHLWSLSVEEQFYLLWPATLALGGLAGGARVAIAVLFAAPLLRFFTPWFFPDLAWSVGSSFQTNMDALGIGCLLALKREPLWNWTLYRRFLASTAFWLAPAAAFAISLSFLSHDPFVHLAGQSIMNLGIALTIDGCIRRAATPAGRFLNHPLMCYIGVLSYSIYLWQEPFLDRTSTAPWNSFPINLLCTAAAALASYHLIERPCLELRKVLAPLDSPRAPRPAPSGATIESVPRDGS